MPDQCSTCFFVREEDDGLLICRVSRPPLAKNPFERAQWPVVEADDWCGEGADTSTGASFSSTINSLPQTSAQDPTPWQDYIPAVASTGGSISVASAVGRYLQIGDTLYFSAIATISTNGTGSGTVRVDLPTGLTGNTPSGGFSVSVTRLEGGVYVPASGIVSNTDTAVVVRDIDGNYPGADGVILFITGTIEVN